MEVIDNWGGHYIIYGSVIPKHPQLFDESILRDARQLVKDDYMKIKNIHVGIPEEEIREVARYTVDIRQRIMQAVFEIVNNRQTYQDLTTEIAHSTPPTFAPSGAAGSNE